jgi:ABC-type uncharacterized transport system permease subunit
MFVLNRFQIIAAVLMYIGEMNSVVAGYCEASRDGSEFYMGCRDFEFEDSHSVSMLESNDNKKKKFRSIQQHGSLSTYIF